MPLFRINNRVIFFAHVPKTGGTSIEATLEKVGTIGIHRNPFGGGIPPQHWHAEIHEELIPFELYDMGFAVVRHPGSRLASEYRVRAVRSFPDAEPPPFSLWVERIIEAYRADPTVHANHIRPQSEFLSKNLKTFRYEGGLQSVVDSVLDFAGAAKHPVVPHKNKSPEVLVTFTDRTMATIADFYSDDFRLLGYEPDPEALLGGGRARRVSEEEDEAARARWLARPTEPAGPLRSAPMYQRVTSALAAAVSAGRRPLFGLGQSRAPRQRQAARPKVFGLGLSRTGTTSLNRALRSLGYDCHGYDPALLKAWKAGDVASLFLVTDRYNGFEDWPYPLAFREIMDRYGASARYILTTRSSPETWLASYMAHADRKGPDTAVYRRMAYGFDHPRGHEGEHLAFYSNHNAAVHQAIEDRGLQSCFAEVCWEHGDGWGELCALTGQPVPNRSFPHVNRRRIPGSPVSGRP